VLRCLDGNRGRRRSYVVEMKYLAGNLLTLLVAEVIIA